LTKHHISQVCYPPYSPDLNPCNFWLFPKLKSPLKGNLWMRRSHSTQTQSTASHCRLTSPQRKVTIHGLTVRSLLTDCQVTSRPRYRFPRYTKWLYTFRTALVSAIKVNQSVISQAINLPEIFLTSFSILDKY
jgi:hypothetical protein